MASGKSLVGASLAQQLNFRFVDTDQWIEARLCKNISEIFSEEGEDFFRAKEKECLEFLVDKENLVIATGGGMPYYNDAMELIKELGETIYLKANIDTLGTRLWNEKEGRPKLSTLENEEQLNMFVTEHLSQRASVYEQCNAIVCVDGKSVEQISEEILKNIQ